MFKVICSNCKEQDLCVNRKTVEANANKSVFGHYVYACTSCLNDETTIAGWLSAWGKREKDNLKSNKGRKKRNGSAA